MKKLSLKQQLNYLKEKDKVLATILDGKLKKLKVSKRTLYEDILSHIIGQQLSVKAALSIEKKFLNLFDGNFPQPKVLENISSEDLRKAGLSRQKIEYMKSASKFFLENNLSNKDLKKLKDEEIIKKLTEIKGIGKWTVEMILIFTLNRQDVFSVSDLGLVRAVEKLYKIEKVKNFTNKKHAEKILKISNSWQPYRSLASRYLWKFKDGDFDWEKSRE